MKRSCEVRVPIEKHISEHRETLCRRKALRLPVLEDSRRRLCAAREQCTTRASLRRMRDIDAALSGIDAEADALRTDAHIRAFDKEVVPYVEAYLRHSGAARTKSPRFVVPGEECTLESERTHTQSDVVAEYLSTVQHEAPRPMLESALDMCPRCVVEMVLVPSKAIVACPTCGRSSAFLDATSSTISFDESVEMVSFQYKRGNHLQDWLSNVQGLEGYQVPQRTVELVMYELWKQRVSSIDDISAKQVRVILKQLRLRKCYDHVAQITSRITGRPPPRLPPHAVELCRLMFSSIQRPFQKHAPASRKNFLSYSYILAKMLYILGYDELANTLTLLKGHEKVRKMDAIWRNITAELDWPFYPSI